MVQRSLSFLLVAGLVSCSGDPTGDLANGVDHLSASPTQLFVDEGATVPVEVTARDAAGNAVEAKFSVTGVTAGITVVRDSTFEPVRNADGVFGPNPKPTRVRYLVTSTTNTADASFIAHADGGEITINVRTLPTSGFDVATLSNNAPALGDTVTLTAPAPYKFTPASVVTLTGASSVKVSTSADSSQIKFLAGPNANGTVSVSNVVLSYSTASGPFTLTTAAAFTTPTITNVAVTYNSATPAGGAPLVVTLPAGYKFRGATGTVTFGGATGFGGTLNADSTALSIVPPPSYTGTPTVTNIALSFLLSVPITVPATTPITVGAGLAGTDAPASAPTLPIPGAAGVVTTVDGGAFAGTGVSEGPLPVRWYKLVVPTAMTFTLRLDWNSSADLDILYRNAANTALVCSTAGATGAKPENAGCAIAAGTYFIEVVHYDGTAPTAIEFRITRS